MAFITINGVDCSKYVSVLKVAKEQKFKGMETAAGNTLVKPINNKYIVEVGFRAMFAEEMKIVYPLIDKLTVKIAFRHPQTGALINCNCMLTNTLVEYYTIQADGDIIYKPFTVKFTQL